MDECLRRIPRGVGVRARFDSGFYSHDLFAAPERRGITYLVGVPRHPRLLQVIREIPDEAYAPSADDKDGEVAELGYRMSQDRRFRRYVVKRIPVNVGEQADLETAGYHYFVLVTNDHITPALDLESEHRHKAHVEQGVRELKENFGLEVLIYASGDTEDLEDAEVIRRAGDGSITLTHAKIQHDLADLLFHSAVKAAQDSLVEAQRAERDTAIVDEESGLEDEESDEESDAAFDFIMTTSAQDAAVRPSIAAIVLAIAAAEAQVNRWAAARGGWTATQMEDEDKFGLVRKCKALANKADVRLDIGRRPYQDLLEMVKRRNDLLHSKSEEHLVPLVGPATIPGRGLSVEARKCCKVVRDSMVDLARAIGEDPPRYLANCPPAAPDDDDAWRTAIISTGMRDDPDFPKVVDSGREN